MKTPTQALKEPRVATFLLKGNAVFPNNPGLPLVLYAEALDLPEDAAGFIEGLGRIQPLGQ